MLYQFPRKDLRILIGYDFSKLYLEKELRFKEFRDWLSGFQGELQQKNVQPSSIEAFQDLMKKNPENLLFFELFDGTKTSRNGKILEMFLRELSKYQEILIYPETGKRDIDGYSFAIEALNYSYEPERKQINLTKLLNLLVGIDIIQDNPFSNKVFLFDQDMYTPGRDNWCYGITQPVSSFKFGKKINFNILFCSTKRIKAEALLFDLFAHEFGHMLNASPNGRPNTVESLGSHCTNNLCVMQQKLEAGEALQYALLRHRRKVPVFCPQCQEDIKRYKSNFTLKNLLKINF